MTSYIPLLTAEDVVKKWVNFTHRTHWLQGLINDVEAYAAQQNAELVAAAKHKDTEFCKLVADYATLQAENERLKQHNKALIPLAAWAKKHGHELTCAIRKPIPDGVDRVVCNCGWVAAHNHSGLTTNQHIELAKYSDAQPPKEAT